MKSENIHFKKNFVLHNISFILQNILQVSVGVYFANYLGPSNYGFFQSKLIFVSYFMFLSQLINRDLLIIDYKKTGYKNISNDLFLCFTTSMFAFIISNIFSYFIFNELLARKLVLIFSTNFLMSMLIPITVAGLIKGFDKFNIIAIFLTKLTMYSWRLFGIITNKDIEFFAFSVIFEVAIYFLTICYMFKKIQLQRELSFKIDILHSKKLINSSISLLISNFLNIMYLSLSVFVVEYFFSPKVLGKYTLLFGLQSGLSNLMITFSRYLHINLLKLTNDKNFNYKLLIFNINLAFSLLFVLVSTFIIHFISTNFLKDFEISLIEILLIFLLVLVQNNRFAFHQILILKNEEKQLWKLDIFLFINTTIFYIYYFFANLDFDIFLTLYVAVMIVSNFTYTLSRNTSDNLNYENVEKLKLKKIFFKLFE